MHAGPIILDGHEGSGMVGSEVFVGFVGVGEAVVVEVVEVLFEIGARLNVLHIEDMVSRDYWMEDAVQEDLI